MSGLNLTAAEQAIAGVSSSVVKTAAQDALTVAQSAGSQNLVNAVAQVLGMSASGNGAAIFYSDAENSLTNQNLARNCLDNILGPQNSYMFNTTQAGKYVLSTDVANGLSATEQTSLQNVVSAMMGAEAEGPVIAFVTGAGGTTAQWLNSELPAILESNQTIVNGLTSSSQDTAAKTLRRRQGGFLGPPTRFKRASPACEAGSDRMTRRSSNRWPWTSRATQKTSTTSKAG